MCSVLQAFNIAIKSSVKAIKFVMDAAIERLELPNREVTNLPTEAARRVGITAATAIGRLPGEFFNRNQKDRFLGDFFRKIRPDSSQFDSLNDEPEAARRLAHSFGTSALSDARERAAQSPQHLAGFFKYLLGDALDSTRLALPMGNHSPEVFEQLQNALDSITNNIATYQRAFQRLPQQTIDVEHQGAGEVLKAFADNLYEESKKGLVDAYDLQYSWANIDYYLGLIGNSGAQLARIVAWGLSRSNVALATKIRVAAEAADNITSLARVVIAECAMKPNIDCRGRSETGRNLTI